MSDPASSDQIANSLGPDSAAAAPADAHLPQVEAPSLSPDRSEAAQVAEVVAEVAAADSASGAGNAATAPDLTWPAGTALVLAHPQPNSETAEAAAEQPSPPSWPSFPSLAAMLAAAAVLGGLAGALATAGISSLMEQ